VKRTPRRSTVPTAHPPRRPSPARPPDTRLPERRSPPRPHIAHIVDEQETSLLDVIDSLLNKGVVLNADLILALADVDLVYVRLSALLVGADRIVPRGR
jgi:hypothetical protein